MSRNFHFAFPATSLYRQLSLLQSFSAFVPEPKNRTRPGEPLPEPKGHDLRHLEAISQAVQSLRNNISSSGPRCAGVPKAWLWIGASPLATRQCWGEPQCVLRNAT